MESKQKIVSRAKYCNWAVEFQKQIHAFENVIKTVNPSKKLLYEANLLI